MSRQWIWSNTSSEAFPYLDALDRWIGTLRAEESATVLLQQGSDGNFVWRASVTRQSISGSSDLVDLGFFSSLRDAQAAAEQQFFDS